MSTQNNFTKVTELLKPGKFYHIIISAECNKKDQRQMSITGMQTIFGDGDIIQTFEDGHIKLLANKRKNWDAGKFTAGFPNPDDNVKSAYQATPLKWMNDTVAVEEISISDFPKYKDCGYISPEFEKFLS